MSDKVLMFLVLLVAFSGTASCEPPTLQEILTAEGAQSLAKAADRDGDARRGAIVFHQPSLACAKCHQVGQITPLPLLGPDLARLDKNTHRESLVESVLEPSKVIRKGFETVVIQLNDGKTLTGLIVDENETQLMVRDASHPNEVVNLAKSQIEERLASKTSIMPAGQVNALANRQQFLDLMKYLIEISAGGPARALQLQPLASQFALVLPEYENQINHAGILQELDEKAFRRGEAIYLRLCINCHGTKDKPGSLPTSLKFAEGKFKNGHDPLRMYQTLTHGFGLMVPQTWMVPQQKYDVIHYVREAYLKPHNPTQYMPVTAEYLASLPKGNTYGPAPSNVESWSSMNYGAFLTATYEVGSDGSNFAHKGIAVRLDTGPGGVSRGSHWQIFDHDTLRVAAVWNATERDTSNFIDWHGINFDGRHQVHPRISGRVQIANPTGPGWADPETGSFTDPRILGRDGKRYGPLPRTWGRYRGLYQSGDRVIVSYTVGDTEILEMAGRAGFGETKLGQNSLSTQKAPVQIQSHELSQLPQAPQLFTRTFHIGARNRPLLLKVATHPAGRATLRAFDAEERSKHNLATLATGSQDTSPLPQQNHENLVAHLKFDPADNQVVHEKSGQGLGGQGLGGIGPERFDDVAAHIFAGLSPMPTGTKWIQGDGGALLLSLPAGDDALKFVLTVANLPVNAVPTADLTALVTQSPMDLMPLTKGSPPRWPEEVSTDVVSGPSQGPYAVDQLSIPSNNPWFAQLRLTGFDFFEDGNRMAVCSWDGDVWLVSGLIAPELRKPPTGKQVTQPDLDPPAADSSSTPRLTWRRIASGLFQPLGLKIVNEKIYVTCRDQIALLRDLNGDLETDFIECFNNDHQVTEHFHEFAMGLQVDAEGNFYYAKSARHALPAVIPHHGTLLRVSADGSRTDILANGFRAANGVCLNPDGTFVVTDQEGHWNPKNRINWVTAPPPGEKPRFYGNMYGYHDVTDASDSAMEPPLCWITNAFDRSPAELLWVPHDSWGPLKGSLLNLSYGYGKVFVVSHERVDLVREPAYTDARSNSEDRESAPSTSKTLVKQMQGGMCELPLPAFPTGIMRGRFHPQDGKLYTCGMFAWAGNAIQSGGFYRIRATGQPVHLPIGLKAHKEGIQLRFSGLLDATKPLDPTQFTVRTWSLKRTAEYGSQHFNEKSLAVASARLSDDHSSVTIEIPEIAPTWCMSIEYRLTSSNGEPINGLIHNTIHSLNE